MFVDSLRRSNTLTWYSTVAVSNCSILSKKGTSAVESQTVTSEIYSEAQRYYRITAHRAFKTHPWQTVSTQMATGWRQHCTCFPGCRHPRRPAQPLLVSYPLTIWDTIRDYPLCFIKLLHELHSNTGLLRIADFFPGQWEHVNGSVMPRLLIWNTCSNTASIVRYTHLRRMDCMRCSCLTCSGGRWLIQTKEVLLNPLYSNYPLNKNER